MAEPTLPAHVSGHVTRFKGNGRKLGYPTANLVSETTLHDGVYFGYADLAGYKDHPAIIFVGTPTTVGDTVRRVEAWLIDIPDQDYYDKKLTLRLEHYHRENQTFPSVEALLSVMKADEKTGRQWFGLPID
jgi:riboflavin kinase / FMN adenylyltransferase